MSDSNAARGGTHYRAVGVNVALKNLTEVSRLFQMAFFVVIARRFGPGGLGDLTVLMMVGSVVGLIFGDLGINTTAIAKMNRTTGRERDGIASAGSLWKVGLSIVSLGLMIPSMRYAVPSGTWPEILAIAVISVGGVWLEFLSALTNGVNRLGVETKLRHFYRAAVYGCGATLALLLGLTSVLIFMAVANILVLLWGFLLIRARVVPVTLHSERREVSGLLKEALPVWITQVAQLTYLKLDVVILGVLHVASQEIGWYAAAWKIVDLLTTIPALLATAVLPLISGALPDTDASAIAPAYLKVMYVLPFLFVLPLAIGSDWIIRLLYGKDFTATAEVLCVLVWALVPICVHSFLANLAVATRRQVEAAKLGALTAVLGLIAALVFVPWLGYSALAVISMVANSLFAIAMVRRFRDATGSTHYAIGIKSLVAALGVYGLSLVLASYVPPVAMTAGGVVAFGCALLLLRVVTFRDLNRGWRLAGSLLWNREVEEVSVA